MKYAVFDSGKPANNTSLPEISRDTIWSENTFDSLWKARVYAKRWLGDYFVPRKHLNMEPNVPVSYPGGQIEIKQIS